MALFRHKPTLVEAVEASAALAAASTNWDHMPDWLRAAYETGSVLFTMSTVIVDGNTANPTDWILSGPNGEITVCKGDVFAATYDAVFDAGKMVALPGP